MNPRVESFADALARVEHALRQMYQGSSQAFADLWTRADGSSLFGAFGPSACGWEQLASVFPWVASRYHDGTVDFDYVVVSQDVDLAYTVAYERAVVSIDGEAPARWHIRVTHIFRREDGRWMLVHRHGDFAPADEAPHRTRSSATKSVPR